MRVKKEDLIQLKEGELAALIRASCGSRKTVHATYPGGMLIIDATTRWCLPILADMRGVPITDELRKEMSE